MATKDITDIQVVNAYIKAKETRVKHTVLGCLIKPEFLVWPYDILMQETGQCEKVCYRAMERACDHGLIEYGTSLRSGWVTEKGKALIS